MSMSWFLPFGGLEKKICRYLLQRYLGNFFEEKLNLEQLSVDLRNGKGTIQDIDLNCESLNELCENQGWSLEVTGGHVGSVTIQVPWNAPMTENSSVDVTDFSIVLRPLPRQREGASMLESMWSSMSSSMQLAQECLEKSYEEDTPMNVQTNAIQGLETFARTIDSVLNRVKAKLYNSTVRMEFILPNSDRGIALVIKISELDYRNEAGNNPQELVSDNNLASETENEQKEHLISTYATHNLTINGISFYTEEFRVSENIFGNSDKKLIMNPLSNNSFFSSQQFSSVLSNFSEPEQYYKHLSGTKNIETNDDNSKNDKSDKSDKEDNDLTPTESMKCKLLPIAELEGKQEIRINMKQSESIIGPKVSLDIQLGSLFIFLSPRQLHLFYTFFDIFFNDSFQSVNLSANYEKDEKSPSDSFQKEQPKNFTSSMSGIIGNFGGGWAFDALASDDQLLPNLKPFSTKGSSGSNLQKQKSFEYCESISSSISNSSSGTTCSSKYAQRKVNSNSADLNGDISHFNIRIASFQAILLHEDILLEDSLASTDNAPISDESILILMELSNEYFRNVKAQTSTQKYVCNKNHLKFNLTPIIIEGEQHRNSNCILLKLTTSITRFDCFEILDSIAIPLIDFNRKEICNNGFHKRPEIAIVIKNTTCTNLGGKYQRKSVLPKTEINITLESCTIELDITIYDRVNAVFSKSPFSFGSNCDGIDQIKMNRNSIIEVKSDQIIDLKIDSSNINIRLRFPIIDSRPLHDAERIPWWKQNIRPDFLLFNFCQFRLSNTVNLIDVCSNEINIYYCESTNSSKIHIAKSTLIDNSGICTKDPYIEYPKITIEFPSDKRLKTVLKCMGDSDSGETSGESCTIYPKKCKEPQPFCSKRVCRESDTSHAKDESDESETILLPGESAEMKRFCEKAMKTSKLQFKIFLPVVSVQIKSKLMYEIIYNRINSDLLMWEPISHSQKIPNYDKINQKHRKMQQSVDQMLWSCGMMDSIYIPTSDNNDINSSNNGAAAAFSSSDTEFEADSIYYSAYDKKRTIKRSSQSVIPSLSLSDCSFELNVNKGLLTLFTPVRDAENRVLPEQMGEFVFNIQEFMLFSVNGFNGNTNLAYLCIQSKSATLHHSGLISNFDNEPTLRLINATLPDYLQPTLYPTPKNLTLSERKNTQSHEMLSFAIEIRKMPEQRVKRLRLTARVQNTTLKHNPALSQHTWLNQMIDFFDVQDYPIEGGYEPYVPVTEMQLHLWDCSIDYRPKSFPYRAVAEIGNFMLSSNLIASVSGCTLRFVAEECILSLAPQCTAFNKSNDRNKNNGSSRQLVPVLDVGLVDISLRLNNKDSEILPKLDLRASIQDLHIRTCSDSGHALAMLIAYLASDGDLDQDCSNDDNISLSTEGSTDLLSEPKPKEVSEQQQERVTLLMAEALKDTVSSTEESNAHKSKEHIRKKDKGVELFFFPDENQLKVLTNNDANYFEKENTSQEGSVTRSSSEEWRFTKNRRESESSNELRDILNFESSVMNLSYSVDNDETAVEALPEIREELGKVPCKNSNVGENLSRKSSISLDEDFYFVGDEEKMNCGIKDVKVSPDPIRIVDNHFTMPNGKPDLLKAPEGFPTAVMRYTLCEMTFTWHLYGGNDFPVKDQTNNLNDKENIYPSRKGKMSDAYKMGVSYSKGQQTVQFGKKPITKISWKNRGGSERNHEVAVEIQLTKVRLSHEMYPNCTTQASRQVLVVSELEIRDRLQTSEINKFLYHPSAKHLSNKSSQHMIVIKALHVRPNLRCSTEECSLRISLLPLRLNIDQDTLLFLVKFFNDFAKTKDSNDDNAMKKQSQLQEPVMMVDDIPEAMQDLQARKMVSTNLELLMEDNDEFKRNKDKSSPKIEQQDQSDSDNPIYFKEIIFSPEVLIRLDYHGRRIELTHGPVAGLLMGLGQLQCSEIRLKKISYKRGILGFDKLMSYLFKEWLQDIKKNQLPAIFSGFGPMYTFVQLFQGLRDLIWLPIEQYQKDGRIVRGIQLGAQSFTARTALAALEITSRIIQLLQITAETAYDMVSPGPSPFRRRGRNNRKGKRKRPHHPQDIREGVATAYQIVKDGINETACALIENTVAEHDQKGYTGAVGAVFRQVPPMVVCPVVLAAQATTNVLNGVKNQLVPDAKFENQMKWKDDTD